MIEPFASEIRAAAGESTCLKRVTVCVLLDDAQTVIACESNRCDPPNGICQRLARKDQQETYPVTSSCNWTHAEIRAIRSAPWDAVPSVARIYGHEWPCPTCEEALRNNGIERIEVFPGFAHVGLRGSE